MKKITALLLTLTTLSIFAVFAFTVGISADAWDGSSVDTSWYNTTDTRFTLTTGAQLAGLAAIVGGRANGIAIDDFSGKTIILGADVDLGSRNWTPIGLQMSSSVIYSFKGTFDGQKHTVSNLSITMSETATNGIRYGFFGHISGMAKDINFKNARIITNAGCYSAVVAGYIGGGTVARCTVDAGSIVECYTTANGMIAGRVETGGTIDSCINYGTITGYGLDAATGNVIVGGIVGLAASSTVKNCVNYGDVTALAQTGLPSQAGAAGISGFVNAATISDCVNYGNISFIDYLNSNTGTGGIVGKFHSGANSSIINCYNFGSVQGKAGDTTQTGLLAGLPAVIGTIESCYSVPSGSLAATGSTIAAGFTVSNVKIVAKTDAGYAAFESAAAAIERAIFDVTYKLTIHYVYENGEKAADDYVCELREGADYSIDSPSITGYSADAAIVSGKMGGSSAEITVRYSVRMCNLTIEYVYEDGAMAADSYVATQPYGTEFSVKSPEIAGYVPNFAVVEGKYETNRTITVKYKANGTLTTAFTESAEKDTRQAVTATADTDSGKSGGCGSAVGTCAVFFALAAVFGSVSVLKKVKD
jgi:hypothetical protein